MRLSDLIGPLPSIGLPRPSTTRPSRFLADRDVHDCAGALDGIAFLDRAVIAENNDADVVGFKVQRHAADAAGKLDHFASLDVVEAVDAGDTVTDGQHLTDFRDLGLLALKFLI